MIINGEYYESYEDWCEETLKYMQCQKESFDFGEGEIVMSETGGEYAMYKFSILYYLNSFHDDDYILWRKEQFRNKLNAKLEDKFDELSNNNLQQKLDNRYDTKMKYRKKQLKLVKEQFGKRLYVPFYNIKDENGNEYIQYANVNRSGDRKRKYKRNKQTTRSYQHYCEYCEKAIVYDDETLCDNCYLNFEAEGILVYKYWQENWIWANNDFSEYEVKDGHWWFHDYYDWEEKRWNILHMKLN